jgi:predicted dehydrogenase
MRNSRSYAIVGAGHRAAMYLNALVGPHAGDGRLVAVCDSNPGRAARSASIAKQAGVEVPTYRADAFDVMLSQHRPDRVVVTTPDNWHAHYVVRALEAGCDVVTEKPLTIDAESCKRILAARARTGRSVIVCFNYRYSPVRTLLKQVLLSGIIGSVQSVAFEWLLDTHHGADYFRRWHRRKANSGGLFVHKATHHFDLLNWWLAATPRRITARGSRVFYRPEVADALGLHDRGERCLGCPAFARCGFRIDIANTAPLDGLYFANEAHDGYFRDRCVFSPEIDIEDTMSALIEYDGITVNYSLNATCPREGYRVVFNGTRGRIDHTNIERPYVQADGSLVRPALPEEDHILVQPHFGRTYDLVLPKGVGLHAGGDVVMLDALFRGGGDDPFGRVADERAGVASALVGIAANASMATGRTVGLAELVPDLPAVAPPQPPPMWQVFDAARYPFMEGARIV